MADLDCLQSLCRVHSSRQHSINLGRDQEWLVFDSPRCSAVLEVLLCFVRCCATRHPISPWGIALAGNRCEAAMLTVLCTQGGLVGGRTVPRELVRHGCAGGTGRYYSQSPKPSGYCLVLCALWPPPSRHEGVAVPGSFRRWWLAREGAG